MSFLITFMEDKYKDRCQSHQCLKYMKVIIQYEGHTERYCPVHFSQWVGNKLGMPRPYTGDGPMQEAINKEFDDFIMSEMKSPKEDIKEELYYWGPWHEAIDPYYGDDHHQAQQVKLQDGEILSVGFLNVEASNHGGHDYGDTYPSTEKGFPMPIVAYRLLYKKQVPKADLKECLGCGETYDEILKENLCHLCAEYCGICSNQVYKCDCVTTGRR